MLSAALSLAVLEYSGSIVLYGSGWNVFLCQTQKPKAQTWLPSRCTKFVQAVTRCCARLAQFTRFLSKPFIWLISLKPLAFLLALLFEKREQHEPWRYGRRLPSRRFFLIGACIAFSLYMNAYRDDYAKSGSVRDQALKWVNSQGLQTQWPANQTTIFDDVFAI